MTSYSPNAPSPSDRPVDAAAAISTEPIIRAFHRHAVEFVLATLVLAIVYLSFVPFDFTAHPQSVTPRMGRVIAGLGTRPFNLPDILANICYYTPLGAFAYGVLRRRGRGRIVSAMLLIMVGGGLSFGVEFVQRWTTNRVPAWADVVSNVLGLMTGAAGAVLFEGPIRRLWRGARNAFRADLPGALSKLAVCAVLLIQVRPYDLAADLPRTARDVIRYGDFRPSARYRMLGLGDFTGPSGRRLYLMNRRERLRSEYLLECVADAAAYSVVAALMAVSLARSHGTVRPGHVLWCGFVTISLATLVTAIRAVLVSRGLDTAQVVSGVAGWLVGSAVAICICRNARQLARGDEADPTAVGYTARVATAARPWIAALGASALIWVLMYEIVPFDLQRGAVSEAGSMGRLVMLPFAGVFTSTPGEMVADVSGKLLRFGALAACLAGVVRHLSGFRWRTRAAAVVVSTTIVVSFIQMAHLLSPSHVCDVTNPLLAVVAAFLTVVGIRWAVDYHASLGVVADDWLTSQMIDGVSYDKDALAKLRKGARSRGERIG